MRLKKYRQNSGLTLLEVIIALSVAGIMAVGVISSMITSMHAQKMATELAKAQNISQEIMEEFRTYSFAFIKQEAEDNPLVALDTQSSVINRSIIYPYNGNVDQAQVNVWAVHQGREIFRVASVFTNRSYSE